MNDFKKSLVRHLVKYGVAIGIGAAFVGLIVSLRDFTVMSESEKIKNWADAFTIPGVIYVMLGIMVWISTTGFFDMLSYGLSRAGRMFVPFLSAKRNDETFYDYKVRKNSDRFSGYSFMFIVGAIFIVIGVVFTILFYTVWDRL